MQWIRLKLPVSNTINPPLSSYSQKLLPHEKIHCHRMRLSILP